MYPKYLLPLTFSVCLAMANTSSAQTAAPAADSAAASASASAPAASATGRGRGRGTGGGAPAAPAGGGKPVAAWDRPADGPAFFTDDFESGTLNPKVWVSKATGTATVKVETDMVAHGKYALHMHYPAGSHDFAVVGLSIPEAMRDHFYGRVYVYMPVLPTGHCVYMTSGSVGYPVSNFLEIGSRANLFQPSFQQNGAGVPRFEDHPSEGAAPVGRWYCLEWEFMDKPDRIVMWVDGKLTVNQTFSMNGNRTGLTGGFFEFDIGFHAWTAPTRDVDIYYDDIAISDKPIGQLTPVAAPAAAKPATPAPAAASVTK